MFYAYYYKGYFQDSDKDKDRIMSAIEYDMDKAPKNKPNRTKSWYAIVEFEKNNMPFYLSSYDIESGFDKSKYTIFKLNKDNKINQDRLKKELDKMYNFNKVGTMSLNSYIKQGNFVNKVTAIRNHSKRKINLEYKKLKKDHYDYMIFNSDGVGIDIPKIVYDSLDLRERISDNRF